MVRTNIDIDDDLVREVMRRYSVTTKKQAVDLALRRLVGEPITTEFVAGLEGIGWIGDLDEMRRRQDVEQQLADRVGRVVDGSAEVELDLTRREFVGGCSCIGQRPASRSSLVTTSVSPARQAAKACRSPGRSRFAPVSPWST